MRRCPTAIISGTSMSTRRDGPLASPATSRIRSPKPCTETSSALRLIARAPSASTPFASACSMASSPHLMLSRSRKAKRSASSASSIGVGITGTNHMSRRSSANTGSVVRTTSKSRVSIIASRFSFDRRIVTVPSRTGTRLRTTWARLAMSAGLCLPTIATCGAPPFAHHPEPAPSKRRDP